MAVSMVKGQKINLEKPGGGTLSRVRMGLGWDVARGRLGLGGRSVDLDASCLLFDASGTLADQVWFRQLRSRDGAVQHTGDNLTGAGEGDDEAILVDLPAVPAHIATLVFTVNSFTGQDFSRIENAFCRLVDEDDGGEVARYSLSDRGKHTAIVMSKLYRHSSGWKMGAIGENTSGRTFHELLPTVLPHL